MISVENFAGVAGDYGEKFSAERTGKKTKERKREILNKL